MVTEDMTTDLKGAFIPDLENEMSRRYLRVIQRWVPVCLSYFEDWPVRPDCGHFFGGAHWYGNETSLPVKALALVGTSPEYDSSITGVSKEELRRIAIKGIRYLCFTHDTGPEDCVRPEGLGRPEVWGTKWGERGRGFFPESQCGTTISNITSAALILRPWIDDETWMMLAAICEDYLGRFGDMPPRSGVYVDTQMEENMWTSHGLAACYLFLSGHERAGEWEENAKRWMFCTATAPQDRLNEAVFGDGTTVRALTGKTFTMHPDYMAENHGIVHPNYIASGVLSTGNLGNLYRLYGRIEPKHAYWNRRVIYDNLKRMTDLWGFPHCVQGMDWTYLTPKCWLHCAAYLYLKDPDAGYFERASLDLVERIQESNGGRLINAEVAEKCHDVQDPMIMKEINMAGLAGPYLAHRLIGSDAPEPTPEKEIHRKFQGVKVYPHSGFVFHRHSKGQTSLSWRNDVMALPLTRDGMLTIGPSSGTLLGKVSVKEYPPSQELISLHVAEGDGFAAAMVNDLSQGSVRQQVLFASLPDGSVACLERLIALKECTVERVQQGYLCIMNENFPKVEGNCNGRRTLYHPGGKETFKGFVGESTDDDILFPIDHPRWLNVDDRIGIVFEGTGRTIYINRHHFKPYHAIADDLYLSLQDEERRHHPGELISELAFLILPEQPHEETPGQLLVKALSPEDAACLITSGYLCAANFKSERRPCEFRTARMDIVPIFPGSVRMDRDGISYNLTLGPGQAILSEASISLETDGILRAEAIPGGAVFLINEGKGKAEVRLIGADRERTVALKPGEVVEVGNGHGVLRSHARTPVLRIF